MKVFVGLSGGVDSAVSTALLKAQGHDVVGVFIKIWRPEFIECTWKEDRLDAMRVCAALSIPFRELDLSDEYKKTVVDTMVEAYRRGITPNPDVLCNRDIKFGAFLRWALAQGAQRIATGHYARIEQKGNALHLLRGADAGKDQSYFLYRLTQESMAHSLFPVGGMKKTEVRAHALRYGLPVATKRDSQGLCFIGDVSMPDFLGRFLPPSPGPVVDESGGIIGEHEGAALLTVGQRHGFALFASGASVPHYVVSIDAQKNTVVVSPRKEAAALKNAMLCDAHWIGDAPADGERLEIQTRYRQEPAEAAVRMHGADVCIEFNEPHIAPPGQSLVVYRGQECLGGGVIAVE